MTQARSALMTSLLSGLAGATALTVAHESARRALRDAPRADTLGRRAIARGLEGLGIEPPGRDTLQGVALAGDLVTNTLYYALVGLGGPSGALARGAALGVAAGLGAVALPPKMGLGWRPTRATPRTKAMTVSWYLIGGLAAAGAYLALTSRRGPEGVGGA